MTGTSTTEASASRAATIVDVAARAGVGTATVSRVLNDGQVSASARDKVLAAIGELDYRPSASARALVSGTTGSLGMVIPFFINPSAVERMRGVLAGLNATGFELVLCNVADPAEREEYLGRRAPLDRTDGMLIISLSPRDEEADAFARAGVPVVLVDAYHPRLPSLVTDDVQGGMLATRHLLELGHERIAFVGDTTDVRFGFVASRRRLLGYRRALQEAGVPVHRALQREGPHGRLSAHRLTRELLSLRQPPTAIFAASDIQALGVLEAAGVEGFAVPDDLSVVGFDDLEVAPYVGLTTVRQPLQESGRRGIERLAVAVRGDDHGPLEERLDLSLESRRTTAPPH
jgi:LacI family transcriptional regulator